MERCLNTLQKIEDEGNDIGIIYIPAEKERPQKKKIRWMAVGKEVPLRKHFSDWAEIKNIFYDSYVMTISSFPTGIETPTYMGMYICMYKYVKIVSSIFCYDLYLGIM